MMRFVVRAIHNQKVNKMEKVYVCDAPFNMDAVGKLTKAELDELKTEIVHYLVHELAKGCPKWTACEWLMYIIEDMSSIKIIETWNEFNR